MAYEFKATEAFWKSFNKLPAAQQKRAAEVFETIFKINPENPCLRPHKINRLSSRYRETVRSVTIDGDLRAIFVIRGNVIVTLDIGSHAIYK